MTTESVLTHHLQAISQGVDAVLADYTERSILFTPDRTYRGLEELRGFFAAFISDSPPGLIPAITVTRQEIDGEVAYILWKADPFIPFASDTFLVRDGKIAVQTLALPPSPAS